MTTQYFRRLGSRKFARMSDRQINTALKKAVKQNIITEIPDTNDEQLILLRKIAVVVSDGYAFYKKNL